MSKVPSRISGVFTSKPIAAHNRLCIVFTTINPLGVTLASFKVSISIPQVDSNTKRGRMLAMFGAWANVVYVALVNGFLAVAELFHCEVQISSMNLLIFNIGSCVLVAWFSLLSSCGGLVALFKNSAGADAVDGEKIVGTNLWIPVTFQFLLAGWLIYASGGLTTSAFISVPMTMMIIGYGVYPVPSIELPANPKTRDLLVFAWRVLCFYMYPQLLFAFLMLALAMLQIYDPLHTHPAPVAESVIIPCLSLSIGMFVASVAKRSMSDRPLT